MLRSSLEEVVQTSLEHSKREVGKTSTHCSIQWFWSSSPPSLFPPSSLPSPPFSLLPPSLLFPPPSLSSLPFSSLPLSLPLSLSLLLSLQRCDSLESVSSCSEELEDSNNVPIPPPLEDGVVLEFASLPPTRHSSSKQHSLATRSLSATQRRGRPQEEREEESDRLHVVEAMQQENRALGESPAEEKNGGSPLVADCNIQTARLAGESWPTSEESTVHAKHSDLAQLSPELHPVSSSTPEPGSHGSPCVLDSDGDGDGDGEGKREANLSKVSGGCMSESLTEETLRVITQKVRRMDTR